MEIWLLQAIGDPDTNNTVPSNCPGRFKRNVLVLPFPLIFSPFPLYLLPQNSARVCIESVSSLPVICTAFHLHTEGPNYYAGHVYSSVSKATVWCLSVCLSVCLFVCTLANNPAAYVISGFHISQHAVHAGLGHRSRIPSNLIPRPSGRRYHCY